MASDEKISSLVAQTRAMTAGYAIGAGREKERNTRRNGNASITQSEATITMVAIIHGLIGVISRLFSQLYALRRGPLTSSRPNVIRFLSNDTANIERV